MPSVTQSTCFRAERKRNRLVFLAAAVSVFGAFNGRTVEPIARDRADNQVAASTFSSSGFDRLGSCQEEDKRLARLQVVDDSSERNRAQILVG